MQCSIMKNQGADCRSHRNDFEMPGPPGRSRHAESPSQYGEYAWLVAGGWFGQSRGDFKSCEAEDQMLALGDFPWKT